MSRYAPHVYTDQRQIAMMEQWMKQLDDEARVVVTLDDGTRIAGTVAVRPTVQSYLDENEREGMNGELRLDALDASQRPRWIWLDRIVDVAPFPLGHDPQVMP
ncbi:MULTISPECIES: DUF3247 family protein [Gammaproteobacteria]|jgi:hypothetical protein|uniref:DUF3247 domain-containing protein n=1 Tax=Xanthomonas boreopolis TaxID=86183 RepID=A0A919FD37_9XANT|nr:DUF3247 family protein [Pseudomonas sp. Hp2]GHH60862.1 hypothetical protein GCM10009090_36740 [[Pseudomonas] boreopolis]